jgi:hypothetical protein
MAEVFEASEADMIDLRYFLVQLAIRLDGPRNNDAWPDKPLLRRLTPAKSREEQTKKTIPK